MPGLEQSLAQLAALNLSLGNVSMKLLPAAAERRRGRRHDFEHVGVHVQRYEGPDRAGRMFGELIDLSSTGLRIRAYKPGVRIGSQVRIRLTLPNYAGISPFVTADGNCRGTNEWTGWMTVTRLTKVNSDTYDVAGRLVDMREIDRGMLGLYLSAQPLAA